MKKAHSKKGGFTLVELLVVISIVSLLASVVLASVTNAQARGRDGKRTEDLVQFRNALELYGSNHSDKYPPVVGTVSGGTITAYTSTGPTTATPPVCGTGTSWTSNDDANGDAANFAGPNGLGTYLSQLPTDPLNGPDHCFIYTSSAIGTDGASDTGVLYDSALETVSDPTTDLVGVVVGDASDYGGTGGSTPAPILSDVIGTDGGSGNGSNPSQQTPPPAPHLIFNISRVSEDPVGDQGDLLTVDWVAMGASSCQLTSDTGVKESVLNGWVGGRMSTSGSFDAYDAPVATHGIVTMTCYTGNLSGVAASANASY